MDKSNQSPIKVINDDTVVFILLLHFYKVKCIDIDIFLETTNKKRKLINIGCTIRRMEEQDYCVGDILPLHTITGCDTVAGLFNIGKLKPLAVLIKDTNFHLGFLSDRGNEFGIVYKRCVNFISMYYGMAPQDSMNQLRYK